MVRTILLFSLISFVLCAGLIPLIILFCKKFSLYDSVNARKIHSGNIPRLGGVGIIIAFMLSVVPCFLIDKNLSTMNTIPILVAGFIIFLFGIIDDIFEMRAFLKLIVQLVATSIVVLNGFRFRQIFGWTMPAPIAMILTFGWILGIINAYNLIDGLDGLCGMLSFTTLLTISFVLRNSYLEGTAVSLILAAAVLGFLVYNWPFPNAKIFMGDGGSQCLGFMIATIPLYTSHSEFEYNKFLMMLVIVSFPMMDTIAAIWRRLRDHHPIMSPDRSHLHHKLLNLGFSKKQALYMLFGIQLLICITIVLSTFLEKEKAAILLGVALGFMICFFAIIHYTNRAVLKKIESNSEFLSENLANKTEIELNKSKDEKSDGASGEKSEVVTPPPAKTKNQNLMRKILFKI